jgi:hypothetical protein
MLTGCSFMFRSLLTTALLGSASIASAAITSTFDMTNEGWQVGDMGATASPQGPAVWNASGYLETTDVAAEVAFFAPGKYLGNQLAAYGKTITYDTGDASNDGVLYAALVLYGNGKAISIGHLPPATTGFSNFTFNLSETGFSTYGGGGYQLNNPVDQATFKSVLGDLTAIAFHADWHTGSDYSTLDNVVLETAAPVGGVPEPAAWALMLTGFGLTGVAVRRRSSVTRTA